MAWRTIGNRSGVALTAANGGLSYNSPYTMMAWARLNSIPANDTWYPLCLHDNLSTTSALDCIGFSSWSNAGAYFGTRLNSTTDEWISQTNSLSKGVWIHLTLRRRSATALDGMVFGRVFGTATLNVGTSRDSSSQNTFGYWDWSGAMPGLHIDTVAVKGWQRALTDHEVQAEMMSLLPLSSVSLNYALPLRGHSRGYVKGGGIPTTPYLGAGYITDELPPQLLAQGRVVISPSEWANVSAWPWTPRVRVVSESVPPIRLSSQTVSVAVNQYAEIVAKARDSNGSPVSGTSLAVLSSDAAKVNASAVTKLSISSLGLSINNLTPSWQDAKSPSGTQVRRYTETTANDYHYVQWSSEEVLGVVAGDLVTHVVEVRAVGRPSVISSMHSNTDAATAFNAGLYVDDGASATAVTYGSVAVRSRSLGSDWWEYSIEYTAAAAADGSVVVTLGLRDIENPNYGTYTGDTSKYLEVGRQVVYRTPPATQLAQSGASFGYENLTYSTPGGNSPLGTVIRRYTEANAGSSVQRYAYWYEQFAALAVGEVVTVYAEMRSNMPTHGISIYSLPDAVGRDGGYYETSQTTASSNSAVSTSARSLGDDWWLVGITYTVTAAADGTSSLILYANPTEVLGATPRTGDAAKYFELGKVWYERFPAATYGSGEAIVLVRGVAAGAAGITVTGNGASVGANVTVTS